ncbi:unnamed protein product, partial [Tenebrio molitor]
THEGINQKSKCYQTVFIVIMCRSNLLRYLVLLNQMIFSVVAVTAKQYASMPTLFQFDDYDQCMLYGKEATYCTITFQLYPKNSANPSQIWNVIK